MGTVTHMATGGTQQPPEISAPGQTDRGAHGLRKDMRGDPAAGPVQVPRAPGVCPPRPAARPKAGLCGR